MIFIATLVSLVGFYLLYNTSARIEMRSDKIRNWSRQNVVLSKVAGVALKIIGFVLLIMKYGIGSGTLFGFVMLMTVASCIILFFPLIKQKR